MRDGKVDILRCIGLAMIILAHSGPPALLFNLRNFDVPLMMLVSGASFSLSYRGEPYFSYLWKRIKRLIFPVWIFLTVYFLAMFTVHVPAPLPSSKTILLTYFLVSGIGYVWIIRVFILVAAISPLIFVYCTKVKSNARYFTVLGIIYLIYEIILFLSKPYVHSIAGICFESIVLYLIPFAVVFAIGLRLHLLSRKQILFLGFGTFGIFSAIMLFQFVTQGQVLATQQFKYPPSLYYLAYAISIGCFLWLAAGKVEIFIHRIRIDKVISFVSQNSIWIYLWHIPIVESFHKAFYITYPVAFALAGLITYAQVSCVKRLLLPRITNAALKKNLHSMFTG